MYNVLEISSQNKNIGIVKVTCALNMLPDIWHLKQMCFVPQCFFIDSCSCQMRCNDNFLNDNSNLSQKLSEFNIEQLINKIDIK